MRDGVERGQEAQMGDRRRWLFGPLIAAMVAGCGVPLGGLDKESTTAVQTTDQRRLRHQNHRLPNRSRHLLNHLNRQQPVFPLTALSLRESMLKWLHMTVMKSTGRAMSNLSILA